MRQVSAEGDRLIGDAEGEIEKEEGVLVIKRIHLRLKLKAPEGERETALRVHGFYQERCPVYRSLRAAIAMTTELVFEPIEG